MPVGTIVRGPVTPAPNLLINSDFSLDAIHASQDTVQNGWQWTKAGGTSSIVWTGSSITLTPDGTNRINLISQPMTTVIGPSYRLIFDLSNTVNVHIGTGISVGGAGLSGLIYNTNHTVGIGHNVLFVATAPTTFIGFGRVSAATVTVDNVRCTLA